MKRAFLVTIILVAVLSESFAPLSFAFDDDALDGNARSIVGADTNPADFGTYPLGHGLIGGPLLDNYQAAQNVIPTQKSVVETGPNAAANLDDNNYFAGILYSNIGYYYWQLATFWSAYSNTSWFHIAMRIDGACPLWEPTTAEILQWAANKWGINPLVLYADATQDGNWDNTSLGDWSDGVGTSSGVFQVADRNTVDHPYHAFPGFDGGGANLARENTCFNADFYAGHLYAAFNGLTGECPAGDIAAAIQTWLAGHAESAGAYSSEIGFLLENENWIWLYFGGVYVPL